MFQEKKPEDVDLIIVSDAEAILGIGDQGVGGIVISVAKGYIYALGAGGFMTFSPPKLSWGWRARRIDD